MKLFKQIYFYLWSKFESLKLAIAIFVVCYKKGIPVEALQDKEFVSYFVKWVIRAKTIKAYRKYRNQQATNV